MLKSIIFIILTSITLMTASCSEQKTENKTENKIENKLEVKADAKSCICAQIWLPVCGDNGKTYSNICSAKCAGVKYTQGACEKVQKE